MRDDFDVSEGSFGLRPVSDMPERPEVIEEARKGSSGKENQRDRLIRLTQEAELFHDPEQQAYASFPVTSHLETARVRSKSFRLWLRCRYYEATGGSVGSQALQEAIEQLEAVARIDGQEIPVHVRVAAHEGDIYLDLCDERWRAVRITRDGWRVVERPPVKFERFNGMLALPEPKAGGSLASLRSFLNVASDEDFVLAVAWAVAAACPRGPYPVLVPTGEQGSAKSTLGRVLRMLIDPNKAPLRAPPKNEDDLVITASHGQVIALDNISSLKPELSDALCRLATGGGIGKRELYSDADEVILDAQRPIVLNGIGDVVTRGDLLDRALLLTLPPITDGRRRSEAEFWSDFERLHPLLLGALLDALSTALANIGSVRLDQTPRMADFARLVVAAETALPWQPGAFLAAYNGNRDAAVELGLEASLIAEPIKNIAKRGFSGTASELLARLEEEAPDLARRQGFPKQPNTLSGHLSRIAPNLRKLGYVVEKGQGRARQKWTLGLADGDEEPFA